MNEWSADTPTEPGHYWLRNFLFKSLRGWKPEPGPVVVRLVTHASGELEIADSWDKENDLPAFVADLQQGEWFGPILPPD